MKKENELSEKNLEQVSGGTNLPEPEPKKDGVTPTFVGQTPDKPDDGGSILIDPKSIVHGCND